MTALSCAVFAPTRLHLGLIDCSDVTQRRFGGVGISLAEPDVRLRVSIGATARSEVVGLDGDGGLPQAVLEAVNALTQDHPPVFVEFERMPPRHVGLGTGTAARLAATAGAAHLTGLDMPVRELALLCGRGGTSGVGVNAFDVGGVIFDAGRPVEREEPFSPSRYQTPNSFPPIITRLALPPQWVISLLCPQGVATAGKDELTFFHRELPVPAQESLETLGFVYHGVAPAILEADLPALSYALRQIHSVGFKRRELARQSEEVRALVSQLQASETVAAGMSSLGPLVFAISHRHDEATTKHITAIARSVGIDVLPARPAHRGHRIESSA